MKKQSIRSNFIYNISYELFRIIVPLITTPYISRILGSEGIGIYTLAHTYSQYFILFAGLGFSTYAARQLAYERDDPEQFQRTFWEIFLSKCALFSVALIIYVAYFFILGGSDIPYKICVIYLIASMLDISYYFIAMENFKTVTIRNFIIKGLSLVLIFVLVKKPTQVWLYTLILASAELIGQIVMIFSIDRRMLRIPHLKRENIKKHFRGAISLFIPALAIQVYGMLDKVMLGFFSGESAVGYYENAQKMVRLASTIPSAIVAVSVPHISYHFANGNIDVVRTHFSKVFKLVSFLAFPMCFGLMGIASNFSTWYYGANFAGIEKLVVAGSVLIISLAWSGILGNMILIATNNQKYYTIGVYVGAALNICLNAVLIPKIGAMGAILASDVAELSGMILMFYFSNRLFRLAENIKSVIRYLIASVVMFTVIEIAGDFVPYGVLTTIAVMGIGMAVYFLIMILIKDDTFKSILGMVTTQINKLQRKDSK